MRDDSWIRPEAEERPVGVVDWDFLRTNIRLREEGVGIIRPSAYYWYRGQVPMRARFKEVKTIDDGKDVRDRQIVATLWQYFGQNPSKNWPPTPAPITAVNLPDQTVTEKEIDASIPVAQQLTNGVLFSIKHNHGEHSDDDMEAEDEELFDRLLTVVAEGLESGPHEDRDHAKANDDRMKASRDRENEHILEEANRDEASSPGLLEIGDNKQLLDAANRNWAERVKAAEAIARQKSEERDDIGPGSLQCAADKSEQWCKNKGVLDDANKHWASRVQIAEERARERILRTANQDRANSAREDILDSANSDWVRRVKTAEEWQRNHTRAGLR